MNLRRFVYIVAVLVTLNAVSFGATKSFTKEATEVVPAHQSQDQVIAYVTQKLTREATEEAGIFIQSVLEIKDGKIEKEEITNIAGSISEVFIEKKEPFTKDKQNYVKVKVKIKVDTESVKAFLEKIKKDNKYNKYKQEIEELRQEKLELEERLKTATKQEYELKLSVQAQKQVEQQKQRAIELNKMALKAKEEYAKAENEQKQKELKRQEEFNALKKQMEQEQLAMQNKIAQEKDEIRKAELENQAKIKELENKAKENMAGWDITNKITIQQALEEVKRIKKETYETIAKFETLLIVNKEQLTKSYDAQIKILKTRNFLQEKPVKDKWETTEQFNTRLWEYENEKQKFLETSQQKVVELQKEKEESLFQDETNTLISMIKTTKPFIEKLKEFQQESFYDKDRKKAEILSLGEVNVDSKYFPIELKYNNEKYRIKFDFSDIGIDKAKLIYQTQNQFVIEPLFSIDVSKNNFFITEFEIRHLGTQIKQVINSQINFKEFQEITEFKYYNEKVNDIIRKINFIENTNNSIAFKIRQFNRWSTNSTKFTERLEKLKQLAKMPYLEKFNNLENFTKKTNQILYELDNHNVLTSSFLALNLGLSVPANTPGWEINIPGGESLDGKWGSAGLEFGLKYLYFLSNYFALGGEINLNLFTTLDNNEYKINKVTQSTTIIDGLLLAHLYLNKPTNQKPTRFYIPIGYGFGSRLYSVKAQSYYNSLEQEVSGSGDSFMIGLGTNWINTKGAINGWELRFTTSRFKGIKPDYIEDQVVNFISIIYYIGFRWF
ncbi:MAG: hypothetical protein PHR82_07115 [Endomicrobiaceae bacterium]|nr:hypothetical protein [Endomicrobiaceae bacterium]